MKKSTILFLFILITIHCSLAQQYGWQDISANIPVFPYDTIASLTDVFFINDNEGWVATNHSYNDTAAILHTMDGGETFEVQTTLYSCNAIHMLNENEGYAGGKSGFVYRTVDGGENWDFHGSIATTLTDISFPPVGDTGYCCGINGNIWSIYSSGVTKMTSNVNGDLSSISFPMNSEEGWVCGGSVIRHYTSNSWNGDQDMPSGGYNGIYMVDSLNGWAAGDNGVIINTIDGYNWETQQTNPAYILTDVFFLTSLEGWVAGSGGTILHTIDGGTNWNMEAAGLNNNILRGVHFTSPTNGYVVGNSKILLKFGVLTGMSEKYENIQFEIYPNPASSVVSLRSVVFSRQPSSVKIFDLSGKKLLEKQIPVGNEDFEVDVSGLKNGIYFCRLTTDGKSSTRKLIIQK